MGELYGEYNLMTMEWKDGLMAITIRRCVKVIIICHFLVKLMKYLLEFFIIHKISYSMVSTINIILGFAFVQRKPLIICISY